MAMYAVPEETLTGIADAIRSKTGSDDFIPVSAMAAAVESISGGSTITPIQFPEDREIKGTALPIPPGTRFVCLSCRSPIRNTTSGGRTCGLLVLLDNVVLVVNYGNTANSSYVLTSGQQQIAIDDQGVLSNKGNKSSANPWSFMGGDEVYNLIYA